MSKHILDRAVWNALSTRQAHVATGGEFARRFFPDIGPLAATCDDSPQSLKELTELVPPTDPLILLQAEEIVLPPQVDVVMTAQGVQMIAQKLVSMPDGFSSRIERLTEKDITAMVELALLTKPGPFATRTPTLGEFWGIKEKGQLVAMAGERMKHVGYTEVSGVCTRPSARGHGYARALSIHVASRIIDRGETPYLHAYATNTAAIQLYESLGFQLRCPVHVAAITRQGSSRH